MTRYRKLPVEIEARQWDGGVPGSVTQLLEWINGNGGTARYNKAVKESRLGGQLLRQATPQFIAIDTLEGTIAASFGDYIIRGIKGEFYPCKPDIFEATYEEVPA